MEKQGVSAKNARWQTINLNKQHAMQREFGQFRGNALRSRSPGGGSGRGNGRTPSGQTTKLACGMYHSFKYEGLYFLRTGGAGVTCKCTGQSQEHDGLKTRRRRGDQDEKKKNCRESGFQDEKMKTKERAHCLSFMESRGA